MSWVSIIENRGSCIDPDFKVSSDVWSISLIRAHGNVIKKPGAIIIIDGEEIGGYGGAGAIRPKSPGGASTHSTGSGRSSRSSLGFGYSGLPLMMEFGEQENEWWSPENTFNCVDRSGGKMIPSPVTDEDIETLRAEPVFIQKTWTISRQDALEFLWKVQNKDKLRVQFLW